MGSKFLGVMTGVALLTAVGVADAKGPVMTDAQLDSVVAGDAGVSAFAEESSTFNGTASLSDNEEGTGHAAAANIAATFTVNAPGNLSILQAFAN